MTDSRKRSYDEKNGSLAMALIALEHSRAAYAADFVLYGAALIGMSGFMWWQAPAILWLGMSVLVLVGLLAWTLVEYLLHRFVLHGLQPFKGWHEEHHARPTALICAPTLLSAGLFFILVFLPALLFGNVWLACALTLGVISGYVVYAITHHAVHHWRGDNHWLRKRKQWHALHHARLAQLGRYGVTSSFWDRVFRTGVVSSQ